MCKPTKDPVPGDGIRSLKSTPLFRAINYELYIKPNKVIMAIGAVAITGCAGYILFMRAKYESMGFYTAVDSDGSERFRKKVSKWTE
ncbi:small integral membrane protein 8 [Leptopilina heterotoma]|uniref:small integral membrane protein 8 n=1 Tax=Leptopilina heterotoma TaxID=63436 RepID=UPI001CA9942C|nr:small integral membrane protein 8 [Leptopilina heterotoma]